MSTKTNISAIIQTIDEYLEKNHLRSCTPVEITPILEKKGLVPTNSERPGLPLRKILRDKLLPHAYQNGRFWHIPHSENPSRAE